MADCSAPLAKVPHVDPQGVLRQIAPLLVGDCLAPSERLSMFRSSKATADMVLQHAPCIKLKLEESSASSSQRDTAMHLASQAAPRVMLTMRRGVITTPQPLWQCLSVPPEPLWQRLTTFTLTNLSLSYDSFRPLLRLSTPQHLHTLRLERCTLQDTGDAGGSNSGNAGHGGSKSSSGGGVGVGSGIGTSGGGSHSSTSGSTGTGLPVRTLQCVECQPEDTCLAIALSLIDKSQLRELSTDSEEDATTHLQVLPQLQQLHMPDAWATDHGLQRMLSHPSLTHVTVERLVLNQDHSAAQPVSLQEIHVTDHMGLHIPTLAALPLANLRCCSFQAALRCHKHGSPLDEAVLDAAVSKVLLHRDKVDFNPPTETAVGGRGVFCLDLSASLSVNQVQQIISMCSRKPCGELMIQSPPATTLPALAAARPTTVTDITFPGEVDSLLQGPGSFLNLLPDHVRRVTLHAPFSAQGRLSLEHIQQILTDVSRPVKLVLKFLAVSGLEGGSAQEKKAWLKGRIREWLASYPNQVEVDVQGLMPFG